MRNPLSLAKIVQWPSTDPQRGFVHGKPLEFLESVAFIQVT